MFKLSKWFRRTLTRNQFADLVAQRIRQIRPGESFTYNETEFQLRGSGGLLINLANVFMDCEKADRKSLDSIIDGFLGAFQSMEAPAVFSDAQASLLPVIRHISGLESSTISMGPEQTGDIFTRFAMQPMSKELAVGLAFDTSQAVMQIGDKKLAEWGKTFDELKAIAIDNLRHKAAPSFEEFSPGFYVSGYNDFYDASRILLPELAWQLPLKGKPVAMIPNRICLLLTGDQDREGIAAMLATADQVLQEQSRPLGAEMFRLEEDVWQPWEPTEALGDQLHNIQMHMRAGDYKTQQDAINEANQRDGIDEFAATFTLTQRKEEARIRSYAVLTKGVNSLLPRADWVVLNELEREGGIFVPWSALTAVAGNLLERLPYSLDRFRVKGFPDDEQMARLQSAAAAADLA